MNEIDAACVILACLAAAAPAWALEPDVLQRYGGTYSVQCADAASPRLRITADALLVERGAQRLTGLRPQASYSYFGQSPPPGYEVALLSQERGAPELTFIVYRDRGGLYLQFDAEPRIMAALGRPAANAKYRDCDAARSQREGAAAGRQAKQDAKEAAALAAASPLADARFKAAYHAALGPRVSERWLARLEGPAPEPRRLRLAGDEYVLHARLQGARLPRQQPGAALLAGARRGLRQGVRGRRALDPDRRAAAGRRRRARTPVAQGMAAKRLSPPARAFSRHACVFGRRFSALTSLREVSLRRKQRDFQSPCLSASDVNASA